EYGNRLDERSKLHKAIKDDEENVPRVDERGRSAGLNRTFGGLPSHLSRTHEKPQSTHGIHSQSVASRPIPLRDLPMIQSSQLIRSQSTIPRPIPLRELPQLIPVPINPLPTPVSFIPVYAIPQVHQAGFLFIAPAQG
ncbi:hypothetical protein PFISCL1PPCAC_27881, partial [Pristionchus fissidentatus]